MAEKKVYTDAELEAMPMEQLRDLAFAEADETDAAAKQAAEEAAKKAADDEAAKKAAEEQARDEQGRFKAAEEDEAAKKAAEEAAAAKKAAEEAVAAASQKDDIDNSADGEDVDEVVIRREIDLGDGAGVEVFYGRGATELDALKDLNDQLVISKQHASKTVREIQRKHPKEDEVAAQNQTAEDLDFVYKKALESGKPSEAFKAMFKDMTGMSVEEFKADREAQRVAREEAAAQQRGLDAQRVFVAAHPEYEANPANGAKLRDWVVEHGEKEFTGENLEKAFEDLTARGLLKVRAVEASVPTEAEKQAKAAEAQRIADEAAKKAADAAAQARSRQRVSSTVSSKHSSAPVIETELSEDELYNMPRDKFMALGEKYKASLQQ